ncbi:alpha/beta hydrolase [Bradyrhizobium liaoningense]|uniref:alpha/beta fold hydrolase n=1 Tax=Bradyrhizobium liaoningense TaxID=43992 RepID=UPI001BA51344|nr:alpha/beta hydrolase [Bradyrhizobium liaoningense]MBR0843257.1 alpha/beta hydrolase [Bradyrhizobium liaoningense]MBR0857006.1 alpha/beta hydrolase [Bradyrhizobium liaoningense]
MAAAESACTPSGSAREAWVSSGELNLRVVEWGPPQAPAIVMLHGLRSYAYTWEPVALPLLHEWRIVALDQRGRGRSDWDPNGNYYADAYVRDLEAVVDHLSLRRFVLLGHSMGGINALIYASRHADRLAGLVVEEAGPGASASSSGSERINRELRETPPSFANWHEAAEFWRKVRPDISAAALQSRVTHSLKLDHDGRLTWCHDAAGIAKARLTATPDQQIDLWPHVEALKMPTLLVRGARSDYLSSATANEMYRRNPLIRLVEVPAATHYVHDDNLTDFNGVLQRFLTEIRNLDGRISLP